MANATLTELARRLSRTRAVLAAAAAVFTVLGASGALGWPAAAMSLTVVAGAAIAGVGGRVSTLANSAAVYTEHADPLAVARSIAATLPDPLVLIDRNGAILFQNEKADDVLGHREPGLHISAALRAPEVLEALRRVLQTGETVRVDYSVQVPIMRHFEVFVAPVAAAPEVAGADTMPEVLMVMRDLTQQERIERMRADFVAHASHELRTPLASLVGFVETLQGPARADPKARDRFLAIMQVEAARMSRLIDDLLSLSRIELNAHVLPTQEVDVTQVVHHVIDALAPLAADSAVKLNGPARGAELIVAGDYDELIQVFQNLIENAIKYGQSGQRVDIEVTPAAIDLRGAAASGVVVQVRDYGPGIAAEHIPRLTERFYRVDVPHSREKGGTGLGLAIVKHILNRHRGGLSIRSTLGSGSTFIVSLPLADQVRSQNGKRVA